MITIKHKNIGRPIISLDSLTEANLAGVDLSGASLRNANLRKADLTGASLRNTDLSHATLTDIRGLAAGRLGGAVLQDARPPGEIDVSKGIGYVDEAGKNAGKMLVILLTVFLYVCLTIGKTTDAALITNNAPT